MRRHALLAALLLVPLANAQQTIHFGPEPIEGLVIEATPASLELLPNTSADVAFTLRNERNDSLDLELDVFELMPPGGNRTLTVRLDNATLALAPGESGTVVVNVTAAPEAPGGRERRFVLMAEVPAMQRSMDKFVPVRFGGPPCEDCPDEPAGGVVFGDGTASGDGEGAVFYRRGEAPPGMVVEGGRGANASQREDDAPPVEDVDPYAETPGFAAWAAALAALAALGRRRR